MVMQHHVIDFRFNINTLIMELTNHRLIGATIANLFFLIVLNLTLMFIIGYLTLDSWANINSRAGAFLLSFFMPMFIVYKTQHLKALERLIKFGGGFFAYIILALVTVGFPVAFTTGLIPCLIISLGVLYYGEILLNRKT